MQCVILAGGLGTRMADAHPGLPKSMITVAGRPFLELQLDLLRRGGVEEAVICVGHRAGRIEEHFGDGRSFGIRLVYSREEEGLLGTGGALRQALPLLRPEFLLLYGDSYLEVDCRSVFAYFSRVDGPVLMTVFRNRDRWVKSNAAFQNGRVTVYNKSSGSGGLEYVDYGLSVLSRTIVEEIPGGEFSNLDRLYQRLAGEGRLAGLEVFRRFYEIGSPEGLAELRHHLEVEKPAPVE